MAHSREELIYWLTRASELEHDLACVYLFAAYSLKSDVSEGGLTEEHVPMVRNWKRRLANVAVEEMFHLAQVSNLLTAIGGAPHFRRSNFPIPASTFPFGFEISLQPFSQQLLEQLVCFEMPETGLLSPAKQRTFDDIRTRVAARSPAPSAPAPSGPYKLDFRTVGEFYHQILDAFVTLPEDTLFIGPPEAQANSRYADLSGVLVQVTDRDSARAGIGKIVEQGEAPSRDHPDAHFAVFDSIRKEHLGALNDARAAGVPFEPARPVITNPSAPLITTPAAHELAEIFDVAYDTMLLMLIRFFAHTEETEEEFRLLARGTLRIMASVLRPLAETLTKLPAGPEHPGKTAGPAFGFDRDIHLLAHKQSAWIFYLERLKQLVDRTMALAADPNMPLQVAEASAALQAVGDWLGRYIPRAFAIAMNFQAVDAAAATTIVCEPNGPYVVSNLKSMTNSKGEQLIVRARVALCRCGGSAIKPYCDGTHARNGFNSAKLSNRTADRLDTYAGKEVTVYDNRGTCCHSGNCTDHLPAVFLKDSETFVNPDGADAQTIVDIVRQCPSGALGYSLHGTRYQGERRPQSVYVSENGPYHVQGGIDLQDQPRNEGASLEHYALCRCGHSKNKPFCDGSHWYAGFKDEEN